MRQENGGAGSPAYDMIARSDGKSVVAGGNGTHAGLVRFRANGELDTDFGKSISAAAPLQINGSSTIALLRDGGVVAAGQEEIQSSVSFAAVRFTEAGLLNTGIR